MAGHGCTLIKPCSLPGAKRQASSKLRSYLCCLTCHLSACLHPSPNFERESLHSITGADNRFHSNLVGENGSRSYEHGSPPTTCAMARVVMGVSRIPSRKWPVATKYPGTRA